MKINSLQIVSGFIIVLASVFLTGVVFNVEVLSNYSRAFILPFFVYLYFSQSETKSINFAAFLVSVSIAEFSKIFWDFDYALFSNLSNVFYVIGYINLLIYMIRSINFELLFKKFKIHIAVLSVFNLYIIFVLNNMIAADDSIQVYSFNFLIECSYNVCVLLILSFSLLNYLYHDSKRGLLLFLASVCIVFSEMMQVAYIFVNDNYALNLAYSILLIAGFYLVYIYITSKINKYYKVLF